VEGLGGFAEFEEVGMGEVLGVLFGGAGALEDEEAGGIGDGEGAEEEGVGEGEDGGVGAETEGEGEDGDGGEGGGVAQGAEGVFDVFMPHAEMLLRGGAEDVDYEVFDELAGGFAFGAGGEEFVHFRAVLGAELGGIEAEEDF
jgi:hypothetical protein